MNIKNDPSVLLHSPIQIQEGLRPYRFVLRHEPGQFQPFISHRENLKLVGDTWVHEDFYWGHYFSSKDEAEKDFRDRACGRVA
jgi:hypothetical protein